MAKFSDLIVNDVLEEGRRDGATDADIEIALDSGMHPSDVKVMREYAGEKDRLLVFRCPNLEHLGLHGRLPPKPASYSDPKGSPERDARPAKVSDYDMMSAWRRGELAQPREDPGFRGQESAVGPTGLGSPAAEALRIRSPKFDRRAGPIGMDPVSATSLQPGWVKIFVSSIKSRGAKRGPYPGEAREMLKELNGKLKSKLQHGAQDDLHRADQRGVEDDDRFVAFCAGRATFFGGPEDCKRFYATHSLHWPYDDQGKFSFIT